MSAHLTNLLRGGVATVIGRTPLVRLNKVIDAPFQLYGKLEGLNPGGSTKDRPALEIVRYGVETGAINEETVVVEATSGNMGLGLAQICKYLGLRFICVTDSKVTSQNLRLLQVYGAEVEVVSESDPVTKDLLEARINKARGISESLKNSFLVNQYANLSNAHSHHRTMEEIVAALKGEIDWVVCAASSCGTLRGCAEYLRMMNLSRTRICAVDAVGSVIFGGPAGKRLIPGHGSGLRPALYEESLADRFVKVSDLESVIGCRRLLDREGLLVGGSSGAALMGVDRIKREFRSEQKCVVIFPDRGERYLDTVFDDDWVEKHWPGALSAMKGCREVSGTTKSCCRIKSETIPSTVQRRM